MTGRSGAQASAQLIAESVPDPELPSVTLADLGILRGVAQDGAAVTVTITPTYSGCPALREISQDLTRRLREAGFAPVVIRTALCPPWTSDWITAAGRAKLLAAGVAPPRAAVPRAAGPVPLTLTPPVRAVVCPQCGSDNTRLASAFGATPCTSLHRCGACDEPFEHLKEW